MARPILVDSGNGAYLLYRLDLPNDETARDLVRCVLQALALLHDDEHTHLDGTMYNAARILRIPGTINRKGDGTSERPHRRAEILEASEIVEVVSREQLEALAATMPEFERQTSGAALPGATFDLAHFIARHSIPVVRKKSLSGGGTCHVLKHCLFDESHGGSSAAILQLTNGALSYRCQHNSCSERKWRDIRDKYEPGRRKGRGTNGAFNRQNGSATAVLVSAATVRPERVSWLWHNRIPAAKLSLLVGDPGLGKSFVTLDIAARVSCGRDFPDGASCETGDVVILSAEDGVSDTIVPRLVALGADLTRVHLLKIHIGDSERLFSLESDLTLLGEKLSTLSKPRLVIIDPMTAYLGETDPHKDAPVRALLSSLALLAEETSIATLGIMHLNKAATLDAVYRVTGSIAFVGQARAVWAVASDPSDTNRRLMLRLKANLSPADVAGLAFKIEPGPQGDPLVVWSDQPVTLDVHQALGGFSNRSGQRGPKPTSLAKAKELILDLLGDGMERPSADLDAAAEAAEITLATLKAARKALGVRSRKKGYSGEWVVYLPAPSENSDSSKALPGHPSINSDSSTKPLGNRGSTKSQNSDSSSETAKSQSFDGDVRNDCERF